MQPCPGGGGFKCDEEGEKKGCWLLCVPTCRAPSRSDTEMFAGWAEVEAFCVWLGCFGGPAGLSFFGLLWGRSSYLGSGRVWITELVCRHFPLVDLGLSQGAECKLCFPLLPRAVPV